MAELTATILTDRIPIGNRFRRTVKVTCGDNAADEYIDARKLGFLNLTSAMVTPLGTAPTYYSVVMNALGTGQTADSTAGVLGIELQDPGDANVTLEGI